MSSKPFCRAAVQANTLLQSSFSPRAVLDSTKCAPPYTTLDVAQRRHEATFRRLTKKLAMTPAPSFRTKGISGPQSSHIIFNPPPTTPNILHTPLKFLPREDPRRALLESSAPSLYNIPQQSISDASVRISAPSKVQEIPTSNIFNTVGTALREVPHTAPAGLFARLPEGQRPPPLARKGFTYEKPLTQEQVEEMRYLRLKDPIKNSVNNVAYRYGCSRNLVKAICHTRKEVAERHRALWESHQEKWGKKKRRVAEDRARRWELWKQDA